MPIIVALFSTGFWLLPVALFAAIFGHAWAFYALMVVFVTYTALRLHDSNAKEIARRDANPLPPPRPESFRNPNVPGWQRPAAPVATTPPVPVDPAVEAQVKRPIHAFAISHPDPFAPRAPAGSAGRTRIRSAGRGEERPDDTALWSTSVRLAP